ncbi:hypothetical protein H9639_08100 [Arthrobacter sp. Sa2CUA1]|uniref:Integral membrane protein n=1 Tax=Arthrobacter gallicola TaxID=2762225 RepID=A0ABR8URT4_9MICC|nr:hypothetical protein [Arthrobacter gallicola]MBD7995255.1 hypothetical protein [Arthrobacter gallicola]
MRSFGSAILVLAAVLLAWTAACGAWVAQNVVSPAGFASLAQPLGENQAFQAELSTAIAQQAAASAADGLPEGITEFIEPVVQNIVAGIQQDPGYPEAWTATLEQSHAATFESGSPTLDIGPLLNLVLAGVAGEIGTDVPDSAPRPIALSNTDVSGGLERLTGFADGWPMFAAAAVLALLLGLLLARRRSTTLALAGAGALAAGVILWLLAGAAPAVTDRYSPSNPVASTFLSGLAPEVSAAFQGWLIPLLLGAAFILVLGLVLRLAAGARRRVR